MTPNNTANKSGEEFMRIQDLFLIFLSKWYWFAGAVVVTLLIALFYLARTAPVYTRVASVLIKENIKSNNPSMDNQAFSDMGLFNSNTNVINELYTFKSPALMQEVVRQLKLDYNYTVGDKLRDRILYNTTPCTINLANVHESQSLSCTIELTAANKYRLSGFVSNGLELEAKPIDGVFNDTVSTPWGKLTVQPTALYTPESTGTTISFSKSSISSATKSFNAALTVELADENSSILNLTIADVSTQRAEDVLNTLIAIYNENWIKDKNQIAVSTSSFINDRLNIIEGELGNVDSDISSFKSKNLLPDVEAVSTMFMTQSSENKTKIFELQNQLSVTQYVREYMNDPKRGNQLLPSNAGLENINIENMIGEYNTMLLQKTNLLENSSEKNPLVADLTKSLAAIRQSIINSLDNFITTLNTQIGNIQQSDRQTNQHIASNPNQAKYLLSVERQQKVKESLYLYLLQKREENELSQAFTAYNTKIITPPGGSNLPASPLKLNVLLIACAIGLLAPAVIIFLYETNNTKVRSKKDLAELSIPYLGEIPLVGKKKSCNRINEAFSILRTNLEFMREDAQNNKVIMLTSFNPGSGKTFISINLAMSLSLIGKKVIVLDLDMRKASLSAYINSPKKGISNYLAGLVEHIDEIIVKGIEGSKLDAIPVGTLPPNPTELLPNGKFELLLKQLSQHYDYIIADCTSAGIVADATIVGKYSDLTLFVVRTGLMDKRMLPELEQIYEDKKFKNMSVLLNGVEWSKGYGYGHYGYEYGYGDKD